MNIQDWTARPLVSTAYDGQLVVLRVVSRADYPVLLRWATDIRERNEWAPPTLAPTVEQFAAQMDQFLRQGVTLLALRKDGRQAIGFVQAHNLTPRDGWCMARVYFAPEFRGDGACPEACLAFFDYLFRGFDFRKIYIDIFEFNRALLGSAIEGALVEEGRFRQHVWHDGQYWDMIRFALYRDAWPEVRERTSAILDIGMEAGQLLAEQAARQDGDTQAVQ